MVRIQPADLSEHRKPPSTRVRYGATHARRQEARTGRSASEERLLLTCYHPREDRVLREVAEGPVGAVVEKREGIRTWRASRAATAGASRSAAILAAGGSAGRPSAVTAALSESRNRSRDSREGKATKDRAGVNSALPGQRRGPGDVELHLQRQVPHPVPPLDGTAPVRQLVVGHANWWWVTAPQMAPSAGDCRWRSA